MIRRPFGVFARIRHSLIAAGASLVPSVLTVIWKSIFAPGYGCNLNNPSPLDTLGSPCFGATLFVAYGIGWTVGTISDRVRDRRAEEHAEAAALDRVDLIGRIISGGTGLVLGVPFGGYVLNPCP